MKHLKSLLLPILMIFLFACGSGTGNTEGDTESTESAVEENMTEDYSDMREADLSEYGIMATIMTPPESKGMLEIEETSFGSVTVRVGDKFGIEIVPFGFTLDEAKAEMDQGGVYNIEILEEKENYILYKKSIPDEEVGEEYHVFMNAEIDGEVYEIKTLAELELKEAQARNILKAAKSFKAKEAV